MFLVLIFHIFWLFGEHTQQCPGLIPNAALRDPYWWTQRTLWDARFKFESALYKRNAVLSLLPTFYITSQNTQIQMAHSSIS